MVDEVARVGVGIVGDDRTAKAWQSAEKRAKQAQKRVGDLNRKALNDNERNTARSTKSIIGSMARVERATASAFGNKSLVKTLAGRLSGLTEASSALGEGFAAASLAGDGLAATIGVTGIAVAGTVAVLGAAAYAAFKFADGWAKGAAQLSRTAEIIGVSTKALTEFSAAAERAGVDKGTATGALGGLSQTLNDARYGRNTQALEVLRRLRIGMKLNKDGTVNTAAMLPAIANAIKGQNSSGRRTVARLLGIPEAALPAFSQGGKSLTADMKDADKNAVVIDDATGQKARAADRKRIISDQHLDSAKNEAGRRASEAMSGNLGDARDRATEAFNDAVHGDFKSASKRIGEAGNSLLKAADTLTSNIAHVTDPIAGHVQAMVDKQQIWGSGAAPSFSSDKAKGAGDLLSFFMRRGWSKEASAGIVANMIAESGLNPSAVGDSGQAFGLGQWHPDRQANFLRIFGHDIRKSNKWEQAAFYDWELRNTHKNAGNMLRNAKSASEAGQIVSRYHEAPRDADFQASRRGDLAEAVAQTPAAQQPVPVKVEVEVRHEKPPKVKVTAGAGNKPAVSHAMAH